MKQKIIYKILMSSMIITMLFLIAGCKNNDLPATTTTTQGEKMKNPIVVLETTKGNIEIELNVEKAPITTENFLTYVNEGHYNGTVFHRVISNFMVQGGGFTVDGTQKKVHAPIVIESNNGLKNEIGTIAMARTNDPNSATSQFFINVKNNSFLNYAPNNPGYAVFGKVINGMDAVEQIRTAKTTTKRGFQDWPVDEVVITNAYVKE